MQSSTDADFSNRLWGGANPKHGEYLLDELYPIGIVGSNPAFCEIPGSNYANFVLKNVVDCKIKIVRAPKSLYALSAVPKRWPIVMMI